MKLLAVIVVAIITATSAQPTCGPNGTFSIAGSSSVEPIAAVWADGYMKMCPGVTVNVTAGGSSSGAGRVCNRAASGPPVEIGMMSREWRTTEAIVTDKANEKYQCTTGDRNRNITQMDVAIEGFVLVMNKASPVAQCFRKGITEGGLKRKLENGLRFNNEWNLRWIFSNWTTPQLSATGWNQSSLPFDDKNESTHKWSEIDPSCPDTEIQVAYDTNVSYDFVTEAIFFNASEGFRCPPGGLDGPGGCTTPPWDRKKHKGYLLSFLTNSSSPGFNNGIGIMSLASYLNNSELLYGIPIDTGVPQPIQPNITSFEDGTYAFSRRLYMNLLDTSLNSTGPFLSYGLDPQNLVNVVTLTGVGYLPPPTRELPSILARIGRQPPIVVNPVPAAFPVAVPVAVPVSASTPIPPPVPANTTSPVRPPVPVNTTSPVRPPVDAPVQAAVPVVVPVSPIRPPGPVNTTSPVIPPVSAPVPVSTPVLPPVPVVTPVSVPVPVSTPVLPPVPVGAPIQVPVPASTPIRLPIQVGTPVTVPVPARTPAPLSNTTSSPLPAPVAAPTPCGFFARLFGRCRPIVPVPGPTPSRPPNGPTPQPPGRPPIRPPTNAPRYIRNPFPCFGIRRYLGWCVFEQVPAPVPVPVPAPAPVRPPISIRNPDRCNIFVRWLGLCSPLVPVPTQAPIQPPSDIKPIPITR